MQFIYLLFIFLIYVINLFLAMGGLLSYLWSRNISDIPDPATGLSPLDIHLVTKTWAIVRTDLKTHGVNILKE